MTYKKIEDVDFKYYSDNKFFSKISESIFSSFQKNDKLIQIQEKINDVITHQDYDNLALILENGYKLTDEQEDQLIIQFTEILSCGNFSQEVISLKKRIDDGFNLSNNFYIKFFCNPIFYSLSGSYILQDWFLNNNDFENEINWIIKRNKEKEDEKSIYTPKLNFKILFNIHDALQDKANSVQVWINVLNKTINDKTKEKISSLPLSYFTKYLTEEISITKSQQKDFIKLLKQLKKHYTKINNKFGINHAESILYYVEKKIHISKPKQKNSSNENIIKNEVIEKKYDEDDIINIIKTTRQIYLPEPKEINIEEHILFNNKEKLPESSQKILSSIELLYIKISPEKDNLSFDDKMNIERFVKQRIPEYVELFHSIDDNYKHATDEKNNSTSLLNESLDAVLSVLEDTNKNLNEKKLALLKTNSNYVKTYIK